MSRLILGAAYVVAGFLTFGHVFNANYVEEADCGVKPSISENRDGWNAWWDCEINNIGRGSYFMAAFPAAYAGLGWPVYWSGRLAIEVTQ